MKKILVSLLVLALCAPAMAATIDVVGGTDGTAVVTITADGAANLVGLGLDVDVDGGAQVTAVSIDTANFNIYPDAAYTLELGAGYTYGAGGPVADKTVAGEISLPQSSFALSFGNLNGEAVAGADGAASVQVTITVDAACTLTVCENATRGGLVAVDGSSLDADCDSDAITIGPGECVKNTAPFYNDWKAVGADQNWTPMPDCWCYEFHCRGDADGATELGGAVRVFSVDLGVLVSAYGQPTASINDSMICADFDHLPELGGAVRVFSQDLAALVANYGQPTANVISCPADNYNSWVTP